MSTDLLCPLYYCMSHFTYLIILVESGEDTDISDVAWPTSSICIDYAAHCRGLQSAAGSSMSARSLTLPGAHGAWSSCCAPRSEQLHHPRVREHWKWNFIVFYITSTTRWRPASDFLCPQSPSFLCLPRWRSKSVLFHQLCRVHMRQQHRWQGTWQWQRLLRLQVLLVHSTSEQLDRTRTASSSSLAQGCIFSLCGLLSAGRRNWMDKSLQMRAFLKLNKHIC